MKDPAFLFYSKDFYEGTRMMLPEERACYIDLLIYQHQNGVIPRDIKRVLMYCSGITESTLQATLEAKFELADEGWVNKRLEKAVLQRENFKKDLSISGKVGQFWKKAHKMLKKSDIEKLKKIVSKEQIINKLEEVEVLDEITLQGWLEGWLKLPFKGGLSNKANAITNANIISDNEKGGVGEKTERPTFQKQPLLNFQQLKKQCLENQQWVEATCMGLQISLTELPARLDDFINKLISTGNKNERTLQDFQGYFFNSEKYNIGKNPKQDEPLRPKSELV